MENENKLVEVGRSGNVTRYKMVPSGVGGKGFLDSISSEYGKDTATVFDEDKIINPIPITIKGKPYKYVPLELMICCHLQFAILSAATWLHLNASSLTYLPVMGRV